LCVFRFWSLSEIGAFPRSLPQSIHAGVTPIHDSVGTEFRARIEEYVLSVELHNRHFRVESAGTEDRGQFVDTDGAPVKPLPADLFDLARAAVVAAYGEAGSYAPDAVIANLYAPGARLGLHCDGEEPADAPVVTISLGDTCLFRFAGVDRRTAPFVDLWMHSGDLLVFGGETRRIYHGVPKVLPATAPAGLGLPPGRLSITIRETGLS
jgi:DNA alkylation damage repair protein AlkB